MEPDGAATELEDLMGLPAKTWNRVVRFASELGRPGTGFLCAHDGRPLLVTAKHLCTPGEREEQVTVRHPYISGGAGRSDVLTRVGDLDAEADVAVFGLPSDFTDLPLSEVEVSSSELVFGQDAFILGYPYMLSFALDEDGRRELPLAKRGIVSGSRYAQGGETLHYVDVIANPGFSGGPMFYQSQSSGTWLIGGVVRQAVNAPLQEPTQADPNPPFAPAGLALVTDSQAILDLLTS